MKEDLYQNLKLIYEEKKDSIRNQLKSFQEFLKKSDDRTVFEELAFCILTSAVGPKMGMNSLNAIRDFLMDGTEIDLKWMLEKVHKYPDKAGFIVHTRDYLMREYDFKLKDLILSFEDWIERRDFFASNKNIKGIGYVQASHFLRNIGFSGYAILDKNIVLSLYQFGVIESPKPPTTKKKYLEIEQKMKEFANELGIEIDELDLLLWSKKTGHIPR